MKYIALLRGINAGKMRRVDMKKLRELFLSLGHANVVTYINSGNVLFETARKQTAVSKEIQAALQVEFGFAIPTLVKTRDEMVRIAGSIPEHWRNDDAQRSDVAYLFAEIDSRQTVELLPINRQYVDVRYAQGAILWNLDRRHYNKSHLNKLIGHELYQLMTVRNVNTARFLAAP